ncbi:hypothetical protein BDN70DRAFT_930845 [Pholiota conissans]|uniref:F-box domain-containing protein n=1 Tax=Pholiota conissans TaxID=109636 RepID=A0A9P5Z6F9_9AGAR|nr:hypothetical protein BDN70DRAFT_930845 [Pholiota conissans]
MVFNISDMAPEIVQVLGHMLNHQDAAHLRLTCKRLSEILESAVLQKITLNINSANYSNSIPKLRALAAGRWPSAARATTHLSLVCFCPRYEPSRDSTHIVHNNVGTSENSSTGRHDVAEAERRLKKYLLDAVLALKNVTSASWLTHKKDESWVQETIMKALKGLPKLASLSIDTTWLQAVLPLQRLQYLREIRITNAPLSNEKGFYKTCSNLGKLMARNSHITSLHLDRARHPELPLRPTDPGSSLHSLLLSYPSDIDPLRLHHLALRHMFVKLDHITLPHLQHLKSLDLSFMLDPHHRSSARGNSDTFSSAAEAEHAVGSHIDHIWDALAKSHIFLEEVTLTTVTPSFLTYLERYSGLKKISLSSSDFKHSNDSDECGARFWTSSLLKHSSTIEKLEVDAVFEGKWSVDEHTLPTITKCSALKSFQVSVLSASLESHALQRADDFENIVVHLIDNVSCYLHNLEDLTISTSLPAHSRGACHGPSVSTHRQEIEDMIVKQLETYVAPPSCRQLPRVATHTYFPKVFIPERVMGRKAKFEPGEWHYRLARGQEEANMELSSQ